MPDWFAGLRRVGAQPVTGGGLEAKDAFSIAFSQYYSDLTTNNVHTRARDWPIERAVADGYERVIWCFKSVNVIATDASGLPFRLREEQSKDDAPLDDHPLYNILNKTANPLESGMVFRKRLSSQIMLSKRGAFVEVVISNGGTIKEAHLLPPDRVEIVPDVDGKVSHYRLTRRNGTIKNLEPDQVRWFRDPHPIDPYMGVTPLEAAGLSVELDHFARLYNVSFMMNDGRPGGVLAVRDTKGGTSEIDPRQQDRIEQKFGKGPMEAGKLSVIAGDLSYIDLAGSPRDLQYGATSANSKTEVLSAFGMSEVVLGHSADQTFANSDAALFNYWSRVIPAHNKIILDGWEKDSEPTLKGYFDTSDIEVLDRGNKAKREEAREEVAAGLRSPYSYTKLAGYADEIEETPFTRALYIPSGKTPLPAKQDDAEALGLATPTDQGAGAPGGPGGPAAIPGTDQPPGGDTAPAALPPGGGPTGAPPGAPPAPGPSAPAAPGPAAQPPAGTAQTPSGAARAALAAITSGKSLTGDVRPKARAEYRIERKSGSSVDSDPSLDAADRLERSLAEALSALATRWTQRAVARVESPKQRKGTRHWQPQYEHDTRVGTKALDAAKAVDEETWAVEAEETSHPILQAAAVAAAVTLLTDFKVPTPEGMGTETYGDMIVGATVADVVGFIGRSAYRQGEALAALVNSADQRGDTMGAITDAVRAHREKMLDWAKGLATQAATAVTNGARDDAAREANRATGREVVRVWFSRRDDKVRLTHGRKTGADGQVRGLDEPFVVGSALLMRPGDQNAPLREAAGCRCYLRHRLTSSGRWTFAPTPVGKSLPRVEVKALPRDADSDGWIYEGTPRRRPAPPKIPPAVRPGRIEARHENDMMGDENYKAGYDAAVEKFADADVETRQAFARAIGDHILQAAVGSATYRQLSGMRAYLTERHQADTALSGVYTEPVRERNPDFGKRIGEPTLRGTGRGTDMVVTEHVGGPKVGDPAVERVLWRVERHDGAWGVYPATEQSPAVYMTGSKAQAKRWALDRANGLPDVEIVRAGAPSSNGRYLYDVTIDGVRHGTYDSPRSARAAAAAEVERRKRDG